MKIGKWDCLIYIFVFSEIGLSLGISSESFLYNEVFYVFIVSLSGIFTFLGIFLLIKLYNSILE